MGGVVGKVDEGLAVKRDEQGDDHRYGDNGVHHKAGLNRRLIVGLTKEDLPGHPKVVVNGDDAVEHPNQGQGVEPLIDGRAKDKQLTHKATGRRNANQGQKENQESNAQEG